MLEQQIRAEALRAAAVYLAGRQTKEDVLRLAAIFALYIRDGVQPDERSRY